MALLKKSAIRFSQASLDFIEKAAKQKNPDWLDKNRGAHEELLVKPFRDLYEKVQKGLKSELPVGYRFPRSFARLRRSADNAKTKSPFKDWIGTSVSRDSGSRYDSLPNLYFHVDDEEIFSAGGLFMPSAKQTKQIRTWIDQDASALEDLLIDRTFKKKFKELGQERVLKTKPRDYPIDHPKIELLKLSGWYVWAPIKKKDFFAPDFSDYLISDWRQVLRLNEVLDTWTNTWPKRHDIDLLPEVRGRKLDW
jgi:uncharacterized protein (TIGR02453 family)